MNKLTLEDIGSFLAKLAENSESVYWLSSPDFTRIQYISAAYERIWGRSRDVLYAEPEKWISYLHPDDVKSYHPIYAMAGRIATEKTTARYREAYRVVRPDGEVRWIIDQGFPIYDEHDNCLGVTGVAVDVTKDKQVEEALRKANEEIENANRTKTEFLENMRHDIRTPLAGIVGLAAILGEEANTPQIKARAESLIASSKALLDFLNEILEAIRVTSGEVPILKQKFNLKEKLNEIIHLNQSMAELKNLKLFLRYDEAIPHYLVGDYRRIQRIILELVANALSFTQVGHIKVDATLAKNENRQVVIKIVVEDTGIGIPADKQQDIFLRFKRLTPSFQGNYKGAGLGLSVIKQFTDELDAELYVASQPGKGSAFTCVIPLKEALLDELDGTEITADDSFLRIVADRNMLVEKNDTAQAPTLPVASTKETKRTLLIEDHPIAAKIAKYILSELDCAVDHAETGQQALSLLSSNEYDLILVDIGLPDICGYDLTKKIHSCISSWKKPAKIVALTAHVDVEKKQQFLNAGTQAVYVKPLTKEIALEILSMDTTE